MQYSWISLLNWLLHFLANHFIVGNGGDVFVADSDNISSWAAGNIGSDAVFCVRVFF